MSILLPDRGELSVLGGRRPSRPRIGSAICRKSAESIERSNRRLPHVYGAPERREGFLSRARGGVARALNLAGVQDKKSEELSKGMLQKLQLIAAVLHAPDLLILDEPFSGLDPVNMRLLRELILAEHRRARPSSSRRT